MFYKKGIDITNNKQMFEFLKNHFQYATLNTWNGLNSIANNVKVHMLNLDGDCWKALKFLEQDEYTTINEMIYDWEAEHNNNYSVGFNGRSGGYLVLYNAHNYCSVLPEFITDCDDYEEYKGYCKTYYGGVCHNNYALVNYTKLVQDFDKLCDQLRDYVNDLSKRDFAVDTAELIVDTFNYEYEEDLEKLKIPMLSSDGAAIDVSKVSAYKALFEAFINVVKSKADNYTIKDSKLIIKD